MLYLYRKLEEGIIINNQIKIKVVEIKRNMVKLGIEFPRSCTVLRQEVYDRMQKENMDAMQAFENADIND